MEHVEVLRQMRDTGDVSDWRLLESALDAAIASLSAKQPPAEAQAAPPSAPVGVEGLPERWRREAPQAKVDSGEDAACAYREAVYWCAFQLEAALAQQPAAVDGAMVERAAQAVATELYGEPPQPGSNSLTRAMMLPGIKRALTATLAAQQGGTQE